MNTVRATTVAEADQFALRRMGLGDLRFVMALHRREFPTNVMTRLGSPLLKAYYRTFLDGPEVWAQMATVDGEPAGFLVGVLEIGPYRRNRRTHHGVALGIAGTIGMVRNPLLVVALVTRRTRRLLERIRRRRTAPRTADSRELTVLSHVAVSALYRKRGIGDALVQAFTDACRAANRDAATLATLDGPSGAGGFYEQRGWIQTSRCATADHRTIRIYELALTSDAAKNVSPR